MIQKIKARIEEIGSNDYLTTMYGKNSSQFLSGDNKNGSTDRLFLSNRKPNLWIFSLFNGYKQIGIFDVPTPHNFYEGQDVIVTKKGTQIVTVEKEEY